MSLFLMKGHAVDNIEKISLTGFYMSEKLDGIRCFWDGGITRGMSVKEIPFANTKNNPVGLQFSTGLWTNYAKPIMAPGWFLDKLPPITLDGELYLGPGRFQETASIVKRHHPDDRWKEIKYQVFDSPALCQVLADRQITVGAIFKKRLSGASFWAECKTRNPSRSGRPFAETYAWLQSQLSGTDFLLNQTMLPANRDAALQLINKELAVVNEKGGEGLILRKASALWVPERCNHILKIKACLDAEATVIGYNWGTGKYTGMMGSLRMQRSDGKVFDLSGVDDSQRRLVSLSPNPTPPIEKTKVANDWMNPSFPIGTIITYKYRELTDEGYPKEARFWRIFTTAEE